MDVSVIVCTYNRAERLVHCLRCLREQQVPPGLSWEVLVVDNNSSDGTAAAMRRFLNEAPAHFRYAFEPRQGKSYALNTGIGLAGGGILAFTDDDVTVDPHWLASIVSAFRLHDCSGVGGRIVPEWRVEQPKWLQRMGMANLEGVIPSFDFGDSVAPLRYPSAPYGANMAYLRSMIEAHGGFRTDLGPPGTGTAVQGEDTDFGCRLLRAGELILYVPDAIVHHPVSPQVTRKRYFRRWFFNLGRAEVRLEPRTADGVRYLGIPRYYFRDLASLAAAWLTTLEPGKRFRRQLSVLWMLGRIVESYAGARGAESGRPSLPASTADG